MEIKDIQCPICGSNDIKAYKRETSEGYDLSCEICNHFWRYKGDHLIFIQSKDLPKSNKLLDIEKNEDSYTIFQKVDVLKDVKARLSEKEQELINKCKKFRIKSLFVKSIKRDIFDIMKDNAYFSEFYCPKIFLRLWYVDDTSKEKKVKEKKNLEDALAILQELGVIIEKKETVEVLMCSLIKRNWGIKKSKLNLSARKIRRCQDLLNHLRKSKRDQEWISVIAIKMTTSLNEVMNLIDIINGAQADKIIRILPYEEEITGYQIVVFEEHEREIIKEKQERVKEKERIRKEREQEQLRKEEEAARLEKLRLEEIQKQEEYQENLRRLEKEREEQQKLEEQRERMQDVARLERIKKKKEEFQSKIKKYNLFNILKILSSSFKLTQADLKEICRLLNIKTKSNHIKMLIIYINNNDINIQEKIEAIIDTRPNFLSEVGKLNDVKYKEIPHSENQEKNKELLIQYLGGSYRYDPKKDLNRKIQSKIPDKKKKLKNINTKKDLIHYIEKSKITQTKVNEIKKEDKIEKDPIKSELLEINKNDTNSEIHKVLMTLLNNQDEISVDSFIRQTNFNFKQLKHFLSNSEPTSEFILIERPISKKIIKIKTKELRKVKKEFGKKIEMGLMSTESEQYLVLKMLSHQNQVELENIAQKLETSEEHVKSVLDELEKLSSNWIVKYSAREKKEKFIIRKESK
ncbi:MAG: hypothetical protein EAX96_14400 [Candidatus Lokiarchaeota archaeon]|nr:hypothetical protein [Candidatus Lokiarchaeota archaeon]